MEAFGKILAGLSNKQEEALLYRLWLAAGGAASGAEGLVDILNGDRHVHVVEEPPLKLDQAVKQHERLVILQALRRCAGKRVMAAEQLGISRKTLWEKIRDLEIQDSEFSEWMD